MSGYIDPAVRAARVREEFAKQQAKMPIVDHNGQPITPQPAAPVPAETPTEQTPRLPAPNQAVGASASGAPDPAHEILAAQAAGDWATVIQLQREQATRNAGLSTGGYGA